MGDSYKLPSNGRVPYFDSEASSATTLELDSDSRFFDASSLILSLRNFAVVQVSDSNKYYASRDGVLYSKDLSTLIWYPPKKPDEVFTIPVEVKTLNKNSICGINLKCITGGNSLSSIDPEFCSIYARSSLQEIRIESLDFTSVNGALYNKSKSVLISCPTNCSCDLENSSLTAINAHALTMNHRISDVVFNDNLRTIDTGAFLGSDIVSLTGGFGLRLIGIGAFANCEKLEMVVFQDGIETISVGAFNNCRRLKELLIPKTVTSIGFDRSYSTISKKTTILCEKALMLNSTQENIAI